MKRTPLFVTSTSYLLGLYLSFYSVHPFFVVYTALILFLFLGEQKLRFLATVILVTVYVWGGFYFQDLSQKNLAGKGEFYGEVLRVEPYFEESRVLFQLSTGAELLFTTKGREFRPGTRCLVKLSSRALEEPINPFRPRMQALTLSKGVEGIYRHDHSDKPYCRQEGFNLEAFRFELFQFAERLSSLSSGLFQALVLGVENQLPPEYIQALRRQGLYHQLAISGFNLGLIYGLLYKTLVFALKRTPLLRTGYPVQIFGLILALPGALAVLFLSGFVGSAMRAFFFLLLLILAKVLFRQTPSLLLLFLTATLLCLFKPNLIGDLSLQFSFLATLGLIVGHSLWKGFSLQLTKHSSKVLGYLIHGLFISSFISLLLFPVMIFHFGYFALATPLNTILATFFWSFVFIPLSLFSAFLYFVHEKAAIYLMEFVGFIFRFYIKIPFFDWLYMPKIPVNLYLLAILLSFLLFIFLRGYLPLSGKKKLLISIFSSILFFTTLHALCFYLYSRIDYLILFKDRNFPHLLLKDGQSYGLLLSLRPKDVAYFKKVYVPVYYKLGVTEVACLVNFSRFDLKSELSSDFYLKRSTTLDESKYFDEPVCPPSLFELMDLKDSVYLLETKGLSLKLIFDRLKEQDLPAEVAVAKLKFFKDLPASSDFDESFLVEEARHEAILVYPKKEYALFCRETMRRNSALANVLFPLVPYYWEDGHCRKVDYHRVN